jgi:hypothetical protein
MREVLPSGVNSPQFTGPLCPAKTCSVFPDGTGVIIPTILKNVVRRQVAHTAIAKVLNHWNRLEERCLSGAILETTKAGQWIYPLKAHSNYIP